MTFWKTATKEQKLSQIDGGIECGMTARQVAMNLGTSKQNLLEFGRNHGRKFPYQLPKPFGEAARISSLRSRDIPNDRITSAFNIFGAKESKWEMEL
jgi:hypothetical protein